jgi:septal ring factor EnvC (AmiA/AmiB activator)
VAGLKAGIVKDQVDRDDGAVVLRGAVADREKTLSETKESLERVRNQVKGQEAALATAETARKRRNDEKAETLKAIADAEADVQKLIADTTTLRERLGKLEQDFIATRTENERLVRRVSTR